MFKLEKGGSLKFEKLKQNIRKCKTKQELDETRIPLVQFPMNGGTVEGFYKLQKLFRTQKNRIARGTA